jgi:pyruvate dehydrogenase E1 component alpha subunit
MTTTDAAKSSSDSLPAERLLEFHRTMVLIRQFDLRLLELSEGLEVEGAIHPYTGQEAVATGVCGALRITDRITSTHRGHGHCIAKGARPDRMMAELYGRETGYCRGQGGSMHIADFSVGMLGANGIVAAGMPIANGSALAAKLEGSDGVTVCFFSDGAAGAGPIHESLNLAALWQLPTIFLCENNQWSSGQPIEAVLARENVAGIAATFDIPALVVDGNDVLAVYDATAEAVERARNGGGPSFIEAHTFRMGVHSRSLRSAAPDWREQELLDRWRARDPIATFERHLRDRGLLTEADAARVLASVEQEIDEAIAFAKASPFPDPQAAIASLYAE